MKRLLASVSLVALCASTATAAPTPAPSKPAPAGAQFAVAPADEYFGRLKMSILGVRNTIKDLGFAADADTTHAEKIMGSATLTEDAIHDWEHKYPHDTWIPGSLFALERLYAKVDSDVARAKCKMVMAWLVHDFPKSKFAATGRQELALHQVGVKPSPAPNTPSLGGTDDVSAATTPAGPNGANAATTATTAVTK
jgi:hypothetical protein